MSKILIIENDQDFCRKCASQLRGRGYQVVLNDDVMEALREVSVFGASVILWDAAANDPGRTRKFKAIKRYHRHTPFLILDQDKQPYLEELDANTFLITTETTVQDIVDRIINLIGAPVVYSKNVDTEEEYEITE